MKNFPINLFIGVLILSVNPATAQDMPSVGPGTISGDSAQLGNDSDNVSHERLYYREKKLEYQTISAQTARYKPQVELEIKVLQQKLGSAANDPKTLMNTKDGRQLYALRQWLQKENAAQQWALNSLKRAKTHLDNAKADKYLDQWNLTADQKVNDWDKSSISFQKSESQKSSSMQQTMGNNLGSSRAMFSGGGYGGYGGGYGGYGGMGYGW